jgi:hypothetical protein
MRDVVKTKSIYKTRMDYSLCEHIMVSVADQYMNEMHDEFKYFATWLPGTPLEIGDIGELKGNEFTQISSLKQKGIDFTVRSDHTKDSMQHSSSTGVSISTKFKGSAGIPQFNLDVVDAGMVVKFSKNTGVAFELQGYEIRKIEDTTLVDNAILKEYQDKKWKDNWAVISELVIADSGTVLISQGSDAAIGLKALADVPNLSLANINANFNVSHSNNLFTTILCKAGLTPLFKIRGIHRRFFGAGTPHVESRAYTGSPFEKSLKGESSDAQTPTLTVDEIQFKKQ